LEAEPGPLVTTAMVIAECAYLIERELGPTVEATLYQAILDQALHIEDLTAQDWARVQQLVAEYADLPLGGTDASVIAIAERLNRTRVATLDHRHFAVVHPAHCDSFELIP
jgi:predicted nucleic acid-binding protein